MIARSRNASIGPRATDCQRQRGLICECKVWHSTREVLSKLSLNGSEAQGAVECPFWECRVCHPATRRAFLMKPDSRKDPVKLWRAEKGETAHDDVRGQGSVRRQMTGCDRAV